MNCEEEILVMGYLLMGRKTIGRKHYEQSGKLLASGNSQDL